ncbi:MAG: helix-turn-helix domain-containing protein, partial [Bacteroidales bacterium]|nr:helix-turn-helix domain-containing protein [Bacteroidales bacterium]
KEELFERKISYPDFAKLSGIPESTLNDLVNARISVDDSIAQKLEKGLGISSSFWLKFQKRYDEWPAKRAEWEAANPGWNKENADEVEPVTDNRTVVVENGFDDKAVLSALHNLLKFRTVKRDKCKVMLTVEA